MHFPPDKLHQTRPNLPHDHHLFCNDTNLIFPLATLLASSQPSRGDRITVYLCSCNRLGGVGLCVVYNPWIFTPHPIAVFYRDRIRPPAWIVVFSVLGGWTFCSTPLDRVESEANYPSHQPSRPLCFTTAAHSTSQGWEVQYSLLVSATPVHHYIHRYASLTLTL